MFWAGVVVGILQGILAYCLERQQEWKRAAQPPPAAGTPPSDTGNEVAD